MEHIKKKIFYKKIEKVGVMRSYNDHWKINNNEIKNILHALNHNIMKSLMFPIY